MKKAARFMPRTSLYRIANFFSRDYRHAWQIGVRAAKRENVEPYLALRLWLYLKYCKEHSLFWRERWPLRWEQFSPEEAPAVLGALPTLTKEQLGEQAKALRIRPEERQPNDGFPPIRKQYVNSSGGSTGVPTVVWQDRRWATMNRAMVDFAYRQTGLEPGSPTFFLWGSDREISELKGSWRKCISTRLRGLIPMPAFAMSEDRMDEFVRLINRGRNVENALCFVTALDTLTDYIARSGRPVRRLKRVITGGGTLYPELRQRVLDVLADEVFDMYGSRDMGIMAVETPEHAGLAVLQWHNYLEVLDDNLQRCKPGETGRVYVTALENYSTALIRMDMGDMATVGSDRDIDWRCMVLKRLAGRTAEHFVAPDGSIIEPAAVIHLIGVLIRPPWLRRFQVVQKDVCDFEVRAEVWTSASDGEVAKFRTLAMAAMTKLCGCEISLEVRVVHEIARSPSGKHFYCISIPGASKDKQPRSCSFRR